MTSPEEFTSRSCAHRGRLRRRGGAVARVSLTRETLPIDFLASGVSTVQRTDARPTGSGGVIEAERTRTWSGSRGKARGRTPRRVLPRGASRSFFGTSGGALIRCTGLLEGQEACAGARSRTSRRRRARHGEGQRQRAGSCTASAQASPRRALSWRSREADGGPCERVQARMRSARGGAPGAPGRGDSRPPSRSGSRREGRRGRIKD